MEPSQIIQWVVIGIIIAAIAFDKAVDMARRRKDNNPGYGERLTKLETKMDEVMEDVKIIKERLNII